MNYVAIEASGQVVDNMNSFFNSERLDSLCSARWLDLFDLKSVIEILENSRKPRLIFMFQLIDALESLEKDFSKKFITKISEVLNKEDRIVISLPIESLSGKTNFFVRRKWLLDFLSESFIITSDFLMNGERLLIIRNK